MSLPFSNRAAGFVLSLAGISFGTGCQSARLDPGPLANEAARVAHVDDFTRLVQAKAHLPFNVDRALSSSMSTHAAQDFEEAAQLLEAEMAANLIIEYQAGNQPLLSYWTAIQAHNVSAQSAALLLGCFSSVSTHDGGQSLIGIIPFVATSNLDKHEIVELITVLSYAFQNGFGADAVKATQARTDSGGGFTLLGHDGTGQSTTRNIFLLATSDDYHPAFLALRSQLVREALQFTAGDRVIDQECDRTCGSGSALLALNDSAETFRLLSGIISEKGQVIMRGGAQLQRTSDSTRIENLEYRSHITTALLHPAIMDVGNGPFWSYSASHDANRILFANIPGLFPDGFITCIEQLTGEEYELCRSDAQFLKTIAESDISSQRFPAVIHLGGLDYHWIVVDTQREDRVYFYDPNGSTPLEAGAESTRYDRMPMRVEEGSGYFSTPSEIFEDRFFVGVIPQEH